MTTVNFHTDLCDLLCEGGSNHNNCQLSEQGVLFNQEQVVLHCVPNEGWATGIWFTPPNLVFFFKQLLTLLKKGDRPIKAQMSHFF